MKDLLPRRYNRNNLRRLIKNPSLMGEEMRNIHRSTARIVQNILFRLNHGKKFEFDIMAQEWDNILILDACRADYYIEQTPFKNSTERKLSCGSVTEEFLRNTFAGKQYHDTVYISANPYVTMFNNNTFHAVVPILDEWNKEWGTAYPETVSEVAKEAAERFPNKRLIIHYMQPHTPHLGEIAQRFRDDVPLHGFDIEVDDFAERVGVSIWDLCKKGTITIDTLRQSYRETLDIVLGELKEFIPELDGRTVVTADHGEMLGERLMPFGPREYAHTEGLLTEELRHVPWQVVTNEERRRIVSDPPIKCERLDNKQVTERLRALGYDE